MSSTPRTKAQTPRGQKGRSNVSKRIADVAKRSREADAVHDHFDASVGSAVDKLERQVANLESALSSVFKRLEDQPSSASLRTINPATTPRAAQAAAGIEGASAAPELAAYGAALKTGILPSVGLTHIVKSFDAEKAFVVPTGAVVVFVVGSLAADKRIMVFAKNSNGVIAFLGSDLPSPDIAAGTASYYPLFQRLRVFANRVDDKASGLFTTFLLSEAVTGAALNSPEDFQFMKEYFSKEFNPIHSSAKMLVPTLGVTGSHSMVPVTGGESAQTSMGAVQHFTGNPEGTPQTIIYDYTPPLNYDGKILVEVDVHLSDTLASHIHIVIDMCDADAFTTTEYQLAVQILTGAIGGASEAGHLTYVIDPETLVDFEGNPIVYTCIREVRCQLNTQADVYRYYGRIQLLDYNPNVHALTPIVRIEGADAGARFIAKNGTFASFDHTINAEFAEGSIGDNSLTLEQHIAAQKAMMLGGLTDVAVGADDDAQASVAGLIGGAALSLLPFVKPLMKPVGKALFGFGADKVKQRLNKKSHAGSLKSFR